MLFAMQRGKEKDKGCTEAVNRDRPLSCGFTTHTQEPGTQARYQEAAAQDLSYHLLSRRMNI